MLRDLILRSQCQATIKSLVVRLYGEYAIHGLGSVFVVVPALEKLVVAEIPWDDLGHLFDYLSKPDATKIAELSRVIVSRARAGRQQQA